jgi:hypothetical protein
LKLRVVPTIAAVFIIAIVVIRASVGAKIATKLAIISIIVPIAIIIIEIIVVTVSLTTTIITIAVAVLLDRVPSSKLVLIPSPEELILILTMVLHPQVLLVMHLHLVPCRGEIQRRVRRESLSLLIQLHMPNISKILIILV